jgi:hypothetical protein
MKEEVMLLSPFLNFSVTLFDPYSKEKAITLVQRDMAEAIFEIDLHNAES